MTNPTKDPDIHQQQTRTWPTLSQVLMEQTEVDNKCQVTKLQHLTSFRQCCHKYGSSLTCKSETIPDTGLPDQKHRNKCVRDVFSMLLRIVNLTQRLGGSWEFSETFPSHLQHFSPPPELIDKKVMLRNCRKLGPLYFS